MWPPMLTWPRLVKWPPMLTLPCWVAHHQIDVAARAGACLVTCHQIDVAAHADVAVLGDLPPDQGGRPC